jgi:hypothetical protein
MLYPQSSINKYIVRLLSIYDTQIESIKKYDIL